MFGWLLYCNLFSEDFKSRRRWRGLGSSAELESRLQGHLDTPKVGGEGEIEIDR